LKYLYISKDMVTDAGLKNLRDAMPQVQIETRAGRYKLARPNEKE